MTAYTIVADGASPLTNYVRLLDRTASLIIRAIERDNLAIQLLTPERISTHEVRRAESRERAKWHYARDGKFRRVPRVWTRADKRKRRKSTGLESGFWPRSRVDRVIDYARPKLNVLFRESLNEARADGTANALATKLDNAHKAFAQLIRTSQSSLVGLDHNGRHECNELRIVIHSISSELMEWTKSPVEVGVAIQDEVEPTKPTDSTSKGQQQSFWLARAMLLVRDHPDWSDAEIARRVGKDKSTLSRSKEYQAAAAMARGARDDRHRGHISVDPDSGSRDVEAYSVDPAERDWDE